MTRLRPKKGEYIQRLTRGSNTTEGAFYEVIEADEYGTIKYRCDTGEIREFTPLTGFWQIGVQKVIRIGGE